MSCCKNSQSGSGLPSRPHAASHLSRWIGLNHGVTIIPHGLMLLSTAMTEDDIDETVATMRDGMQMLVETGF